MKNLMCVIAVWAAVSCSTLFAGTNYVWTGSAAPMAPYSSWGTAAHSIQDAVDAAVEGTVVLVTNGVYTLSSQIYVVTNNIVVKSVNGAGKTIIDGNFFTRCIYVRGDSTIDGFLVRNGNPFVGSGGGIYIFNIGEVLNCMFTNNVTPEDGGAVCAVNTLITNCYTES